MTLKSLAKCRHVPYREATVRQVWGQFHSRNWNLPSILIPIQELELENIFKSLLEFELIFGELEFFLLFA